MTRTSRSVESSSKRLVFQPAATTAPRTLVTIFLRGGMDGFSTVPVWGDKHLAIGRADLALPEPSAASGMIDLDGFYGLHAAMRPLEDVYRSGEMAIVHAVGSPNETTSHFEAMKTVERGGADAESLETGWLGRHLSSLKNENHSSLRSVAVAKMVPAAMAGGPGLALPDLSAYRLDVPANWSPRFASVLEGLYRRGDPRLAGSGREIFRLLGQVRELRSQTPHGTRSPYPATPLAKDLAKSRN
ncbi:MAG: hypothetical protein QM811_13135 [Pirellulales bacterium]